MKGEPEIPDREDTIDNPEWRKQRAADLYRKAFGKSVKSPYLEVGMSAKAVMSQPRRKPVDVIKRFTKKERSQLHKPLGHHYNLKCGKPGCLNLRTSDMLLCFSCDSESIREKKKEMSRTAFKRLLRE